ncbi:MAG: 3-dehydroquinate synthase [Peptoniphilaceae bacterium]
MIIEVKENNYNIEIGYKIDKKLRNYLLKNKERKIALISDDKVYPIYKERIEKILKGLSYSSFIFENGENSKSMKVYEEAMFFLSNNNFSRGDLILAFGGGVTGDLSGYLAGTYLRGISFVAVPTSLLSMIDSSVGGKNGINFNGLKNQIGTFYFPEYVHIDYSFLETLDERNRNNGLAEIFKYAVLKDKNLYKNLKENKDKLNYEYLIGRSLEIKLDFVRDDERDKGKRQYLNLGHTIGHGIEGLSNYSINHGEAVGIGLIYMARASYKKSLAKEDFYKDLIREFKAYNLPTSYSFKNEDILEIIKHDKKIKDNMINIIIPVEIGRAINKKVKLDELVDFIDLGKTE